MFYVPNLHTRINTRVNESILQKIWESTKKGPTSIDLRPNSGDGGIRTLEGVAPLTP